MFKIKIALIIASFIIAATLFTGSTVSATNQKLSIEDLINMSNEQLAQVPQTIIRDVLDDIFKSGEEEVKKYDEADLQRVVNQSYSNQIRDAIDSIALTPPEQGRDTGLVIGGSLTVDWAEAGGGGSSGFGIKDYAYDIDSNEQEAMVAITVYGDPTAYAWTGHDFNVSGSGYGLYRVDIDNARWGCTVLMGTCTLKLVIDEWRNGVHSSNEFEMDEYSAALGSTYSNSFDYSTPYSIPMYAGATYRVSIMVLTTCNTFLGVAGADCMLDYFGSWWDSIHLQYIP